LHQINAIEHIKGGVEIGQYILERVDNVHITGSDKTYDMIVWGTTDKAKKIGEPKFTKEFTSELGCVTPVRNNNVTNAFVKITPNLSSS